VVTDPERSDSEPDDSEPHDGEPDDGGPHDGEPGGGAVWRFHQSTLLGDRPADPERLVSFRRLDPSNEPAAFKRYRDARTTPLPRTLRASSLPATEVLSGGRANHEPGALDDELLGTLLFLAGGVTRAVRLRDGKPVFFRSAMSAGNLHPIEIYVVRDDVEQYDPLAHALVTVRERTGPPPAAGHPGAATVILTGIAFRTCWKYGERGWRHVFWDAGTILANLLGAADAHGVRTAVRVGFDDVEVAALLGLERAEEQAVVLVELGGPAVLPVLTGPSATARPIAPRVLRFPLVEDAEAESMLETRGVAAWREQARSGAREVPAVVDPPAGAVAERIEDVILRRGSTRRFVESVAPNALLEWALPAASRPVGFEVAPGGSFLEHLVGVHGVDEVESGGYRYHGADGFEGRVRASDMRAASRRLCIDQPLGGDAAFTVFHSFDLAGLERFGPRTYRVAQLEAGVVAGRLSLCAAALGCGATGLTFFDRAVSEFYRSASSPMLATAVGLPANPPLRSGTPGEPAWIRVRGLPD